MNCLGDHKRLKLSIESFRGNSLCMILCHVYQDLHCPFLAQCNVAVATTLTLPCRIGMSTMRRVGFSRVDMVQKPLCSEHCSGYGGTSDANVDPQASERC